MHRKGKTCWNLVLVVAIMLALAVEVMPATAQTIGMVADNSTHSVTVFNADTDTVLGTVPFGPGTGFATGDCSITADQTRGFVTDFADRVWVINLTTSPPSLAPSPNPIPISNIGQDTAVSPDQRFLVVCDGNAVQPISVIDIATQTEVSTFFLGSSCSAVDVCSDGSVLVTSNRTGAVRRLTIDGTGHLTDTGEVLFSGGILSFGPNNVFCAPDGRSGIVIRRDPRQIRSFTIPGLGLVDTRTLTGTNGISGQINPAGDRAFARTDGGAVDVFGYNSTTGALDAAPLFSIPIAGAPRFFGMDQIALYPNGTKLYVSQPHALNVYDSSTGGLLKSITAPGSIIEPTGVCFAQSIPGIQVKVDLKPGGNPNCINPHNRGKVTVAIVGSSTFDVADIDWSTLKFGGASPLRCVIDDMRKEGSTAVFKKGGIPDLVCHFATQAVEWPAVGSDCGAVPLTGQLHNGTPIGGSDNACLAGEPTCQAGRPIPVQ